ncbi:MAG: methylenetetrahydrofolate reductase C-terminal domain-containing protein [bacterium]
MIISKQKPFDNILEALKGYQRIFLVGCNLCASLCQTGGEKEVLQMKKDLEAFGKQITGYCIVETACHLLEVKKEIRNAQKEIEKVDAILSLSCGAGSQALTFLLEKPVFTAVDTLFLGSVERWGRFSETCTQCGDCILNITGGLCPVTRCPKGLLNGPCGGMDKGKCEIDPERECVWVEIYNALKRQGRIKEFKKIIQPRDNSKSQSPGKLVLKREE